VELSLAKRALEAEGSPTGALDTAQSIADGALHTVRDLSRLLHPAVLDDLGLPAAIDGYVQGFRKRHGIRVDLQIDGMDERLTPDVEAAAYRIVQEALTNVAKHSGATHCRVSLQRHADMLLITIEDDGRGFTDGPERRLEPRGLGLIGMRERVAQLHGSLTLSRAPEGGARVSVDLPARTVEPELIRT